MTVVLGPGWPGMLLHEAIGHGLEGDFNRKGSSAFTGRIGERVAAPGVTVVDDGTLHRRRGSLNVDDEGNPTQRTVLIEDGMLQGYMQDTLNARLMGVPVTGNGRRESFAHLPMPRMTNTYMLNGDKDPQEIIASVKHGLYAVNFGGGQVDITSGKFVFSASEAYMIEDGKVTYPVKGATLIGNGPDALTRVTHDRQRHGARHRRRHLRQGRPERAGRRRPADAAHRRPDGRRYGALTQFTVRAGPGQPRYFMKTPRNPTNELMHGRLREVELGTLCTIGLLGRWRPISGHFGHARLANSRSYWPRRSRPNWLGTRLAIIPSPS